MWSHLTRFAAWERYRGLIVPLLLFAALLSIVFRGAFLSIPPDPGRINPTLFWSLAGASLLMVMHALYLVLMSYHLVYRFPVEQIQVIGLALAPLAAAYVLYAVYDYLPAGAPNPLKNASFSSGTFAFAYALIAAHGLYELQEERHHSRRLSTSLPPRPNRTRRNAWMFRTDLAMTTLAGLVFLGTVGWLPFDVPSMPAPSLPAGPAALLTSAIVQKASAKDALIVAALLLYAVGRYTGLREIRKQQGQRHREVQSRQRLHSVRRLEAPGSTVPFEPAQIRQQLPEEATWVDIGNLEGVLVTELRDYLYASPDERAGAVPFLHQQELRTTEAASRIQTSQVVHLAHAVYTLEVARDVRRVLRHAQAGTCLLVRFTADASLYRAISASTSCAPVFPYTYHAVHPLLIRDLVLDGWTERWKALLTRQCDISTPEYIESTIDWCDAQYGEFSGDIIGRYLNGFYRCGYKAVPNADFLVLLQKR